VCRVPDEPRDFRFEYAQCTDFYNTRDVLGADLFVKFVQTLSTLILVVGAVAILGAGRYHVARLIVVLILGVVGVIAFVSILLDIEGTVGAKEEARRYARELETTAGSAVPQLWSAIETRSGVFREERILKLRSGEPNPGQGAIAIEREVEGHLYVHAARIMTVLWIVVVVVAALALP
jgi:hypothetical protein